MAKGSRKASLKWPWNRGLKISRGKKTEKNVGKPGRKISLCKGPGWEGASESLNWEQFCVAKRED